MQRQPGITIERRHTRARPSLATAARLWGALAGLGGLVHGIGEVVQGNVTTPGLFIPSWTIGPIADNLGGEPGLTVIPNFLVTGILTIALASLLIAVSARRAAAGPSGWALLALSTGMLLVGGGVGPPVIGLCAGVAALASRRARARQRKTGRPTEHRTLWPWLFWLALADTLFLVFGSLFAAFVLDVDVSNAFVVAFLAAVVLLPITIVAGNRAARKEPAT
ncbi:MAG: hypothetical protein P8Y02_00145 [Deinococcales bacterium]